MQYEGIKEGITVKWNKNSNTFTIKDTEFTAVEAVQMCDSIITFITGEYNTASNKLPAEAFDSNEAIGKIINDWINKIS
jgi:hypothetical protein